MNRIALIAYGKLKSSAFQEALDDFSNRISRMCEFQCFLLKPQKIETKSTQQKLELSHKEALDFFNLIESKSFKNFSGQNPIFWVLDETGTSLSTQEWVQHFKQYSNQGQGSLVFVVGGSLGLSKSIQQKAHKLISLGKQTMNHELTRVVTAEQIYRTLTVIHGHPYHNDY